MADRVAEVFQAKRAVDELTRLTELGKLGWATFGNTRAAQIDHWLVKLDVAKRQLAIEDTRTAQGSTQGVFAKAGVHWTFPPVPLAGLLCAVEMKDTPAFVQEFFTDLGVTS